GIYGHFLRPLADLMADRFMLAPSLGLCLMTCWSIARLTSFRGADLAAGEPRAFFQRIWQQGKPFLLIVAVLTLVWSYRTLDRIPVWRDNLALFGTDMPNLERCARCHVFYAGALLDAYQKKGGNPSMAAEIEAHYRKAIMLTPKVYNARIELAQFLYNQQRYAEGIAVAQECQRQFPEAARAYYFLGYGQYFKGDYAEASQNLQKSCSMAPLRQDAPYYLAWSLYFGGQVAEAISQAGAAMLKFPENDQFPDALSDFQFGSGQVEAGFSTLKAALARLHSPTLYKKIIQRYEESNLPEAAAAYRREAIQRGIQL
ncbi:MAG TPA: hypothetical protein VHS96_18210, partial [Bacteroidia bacterium]|nr:hypothetical protein [Bacteroidia bacterium]